MAFRVLIEDAHRVSIPAADLDVVKGAVKLPNQVSPELRSVIEAQLRALPYIQDGEDKDRDASPETPEKTPDPKVMA